MPEPIHVPIRSALSSVTSSFASFTASLAATTAYCVKRSIRRASLRGIWSSMLKSLSSPAKLTLYLEVSIRVIVSMPLTPSKAFFQVVCVSLPIGESAPTPVITTRCLLLICLSSYLPHFKVIAPQVKPPPNPTRTRVSPS